MHFKISPAKCWPFCLGVNVLDFNGNTSTITNNNGGSVVPQSWKWKRRTATTVVPRRMQLGSWAQSQYPKKRLSVRSRKVSKPRDLYLELFDRYEIKRHFGSSAADVPVKFQSDTTIYSTNLVASRLYDILRKDVFSDIETGPRTETMREKQRLLDDGDSGVTTLFYTYWGLTKWLRFSKKFPLRKMRDVLPWD